jgi:hypothetical protein
VAALTPHMVMSIDDVEAEDVSLLYSLLWSILNGADNEHLGFLRQK